MVQLGHALTAYDDPPVKALHVYHSNPAVVAPDSARVLAGLKREDLFVVVHEHLITETAMYADIILPSTTSLESTDLYRSYGHYYLQMARPAIEPEGQTRSTLAIFNDLAARFAFTEDCFFETEDDRIRNLIASDSPYLKGITMSDLQEGLPIRLNVEEKIFSKGFGTPSGKIEFYSLSMADQGLDQLPNGEPSIDEEGEGRFHLQLITPPRRQFLNSTFSEIEYLRIQAGEPVIMIHPEDAAKRGVEEKMRVRVFNDRGECQLSARLTENTGLGVTVIEGLYWPRFMPDNRGVNQLTSQCLTDMGQSCAFHCNLVEVEPSLVRPL